MADVIAAAKLAVVGDNPAVGALAGDLGVAAGNIHIRVAIFAFTGLAAKAALAAHISITICRCACAMRFSAILK